VHASATRWWLAVLFAVAVWWSTSSVAAGPEIAPPVARGSQEVAYPEDGQGDAVVVLELVVASDGHVASATVIDGPSPFAEAALEAALGWTFDPARRGGVPAAARIRAQVQFRSPLDGGKPKAPLEDEPTPPREEPRADPAPPEPPALEVVVQGRRREPGRTTLSAAEIRETPGAFGDAFRAVEVLPGVTPPLGGVPYFFVRGAPPNANGTFVDGIRVPLLFHGR